MARATGLPHSDISGSKPAGGSPKLFAANCVLLRLLTPRHPPCALNILTSLIQSQGSTHNFFYLQTLSRSQIISFAFSLSLMHLSKMVGLGELESPTSRLSGVRSNRLSYKPPVSSLSTLYIKRISPFYLSLNAATTYSPISSPT